METQKGPHSTRSKRFQPAPGKDFEIESVPLVEAKTKGFFVRAIVVTALGALIVTGVYGLVTQKFTPLQSTWVVVGPVIGAMVNHYFGGHRKET